MVDSVWSVVEHRPIQGSAQLKVWCEAFCHHSHARHGTFTPNDLQFKGSSLKFIFGSHHFSNQGLQELNVTESNRASDWVHLPNLIIESTGQVRIPTI